MAVVMKQFIDRFKSLEKVANETLAANPEALVGVDSLPGSEHDAKVPEEAKKPDEEVTQGQPAGATSASGAVNGGDAKPLNEGKLEMDQPLLNPEKKPLITDDALTAKVANARLVGLVNDLLADIKGGTQKQAEQKKTDTAATSAKAEKPVETKKVADVHQKISLDDETISKIAAAQATFMLGREAAKKVLSKKAGDDAKASVEAARKLIKDACVKAAQEQGLDPEAASAAADNAMAMAGVAPEVAADAGAAEADAGAAAVDAGAAEAAAGDAGAAAADAGAAEAAIPEDVTEEELATAIVDLVSSGELDPDTAKALVEEIADDAGAGEAAPTEDQAAEIIAQGIESGEITPEQAQDIAAAIEGGAGEEAAAGDAAAAEGAAAAADAEAQGAADAEAAIQDAADEAQGAADAEAAMKAAAEQIRSNTISKVASAIVAKRQKKATAQKQASAKTDQPKPGDRLMGKVASILEAKKAAAEKTAASSDDAKYIAGFKKKASEMGVDPSLLAKYIVDRQPK